MEIVYSNEFIKRFNKLPENIQDKFENLESVLKIDPFYPSLHTKSLKGRFKNFYSFRVTRNYRVIFEFDGRRQEIFLHTIQTRQSVYKN